MQTNLHTWSAEVIQTRTLKTLIQPLVSTGRVWMAVPDHFRWELGQPAQTIALRQSDRLMVIYPRLKRAELYPLNGKESGPWRDALALLEAGFPRSRTELEARFRVLSLSQTNSVLQLTLQPRRATARRMITEIQVSWSATDCSLLSTGIKFIDGSVLRNDYRAAKLNLPLPDGCFDAKLEEDYTVVEPLKR